MAGCLSRLRKGIKFLLVLDAAAIAFLFFVNLGGKMFQSFRCGFGFAVTATGQNP